MQSFDTPGDVALRVDVPAGTVTVETWVEPRVEVDVTAARHDERSLQAARDTRVSLSDRAGRHEISVRAPKREGRLGWSFGRGPELAVVIRCPEGAALELGTHSADLETRGPLGDVTARSASADATLDDVASLSVATASGDVSAGAVAGTLNVKSASGDVDIRSVGGPASVNCVSGDVRLGATAGAVAVSTVSGDADLEAAGGTVRIGSVSGDVAVAAVPGLVLWVDAQSVSGTLTSELDLGDQPEEAAGDAVELRVRTVSGDVRISRSVVPAR